MSFFHLNTIYIIIYRLTAGELSYLNSVQIENLSKSIKQSDDATQNINTIIESFHKEVSTFKDDYTPIDMGLKLYRANQDFNVRLQAAESAMTNKVNRSEVDHIEALVERLQMFESFKELATQEIECLKDLLKSQDDDMKRCQEYMESNDKRFHDLNNTVLRCAPKSETRSLAEQVDAHQETLDLLWHHKDESSNALAMAQQDLHQIVDVLSKKASITDLRSCVPRSLFEQEITNLGETVTDKNTMLQSEVEVSMMYCDCFYPYYFYIYMYIHVYT